MILMLFNLFSGSNTAQPSSARSYSEFVQAVQDGAVQEATIDGENVRFVGSDNKVYATVKPEDAAVTAAAYLRV